MLRRIFALLCVAAASYAATPRPIADMPIPIAGGKSIKLSQYRGKVTVVLLVLTTCQHCIHSAQLLNTMQKEYGKDFQPVGIAVNPEAAQQFDIFRQMHGLTYPFGYLTNEDAIMKLADFKREEHPLSPMYLFIDKKGTVRFQYTGKDDNFFKKEDDNVRHFVESFLKE